MKKSTILIIIIFITFLLFAWNILHMIYYNNYDLIIIPLVFLFLCGFEVGRLMSHIEYENEKFKKENQNKIKR